MICRSIFLPCRARRFTLLLLSLLFISSAAALPLSDVDRRDFGTSRRCGDEACSSLSVLVSEIEDSMRSIIATLCDLVSIPSNANNGISDDAATLDASFSQQSRLPSIHFSLPFHRRAAVDGSSDSTHHSPSYVKILLIIGSVALGVALVLILLWFITFLMRRNNSRTGKRKIKSKVPNELVFEPEMNSYKNIEIRSPTVSTPTQRNMTLPPAHDPFSDHHAVASVGHYDEEDEMDKDVYLHPPRTPRSRV
ncbi:hypothetical protein D9758_009251 [Tetrapyrgos nigripes]|uniref:Uncharacterized protein n=1 Tax=Tetrapyrgos nigripes TaxID=182062 RepID=A0A8H5D3U2_9AGAR|nr:hypothetical protein D9758_009251 [Tetrapyrgos nigripes]